MIISRRTKVVLLISLLVLTSLAAGFVLGAATAKAFVKKKEDPAFWKPGAMKQLEKLHPSEAQRSRFQAILDQAAADLGAIRTETVNRAKAIVAKAVADVDVELTAEQREAFAKIKPKNPASESTE